MAEGKFGLERTEGQGIYRELFQIRICTLLRQCSLQYHQVKYFIAPIYHKMCSEFESLLKESTEDPFVEITSVWSDKGELAWVVKYILDM
jgi:hypothetical protein